MPSHPTKCICVFTFSDGVPICYLEGSALSPPVSKETQTHTKLAASLRLPSSKDQTTTKQAPLPQAAPKEISPEIPVQPSAMSARSVEGQSTHEVSSASSVAVVLAVLPRHNVPLSWLHQTEAYICGSYCYEETRGETVDPCGRETTGSPDSGDVALQDCVRQVKVVTSAVWCFPSEEEERESGTAQGPHSVSCPGVPSPAPLDNAAVLVDSSHTAVTSSPVRELIVVLDRSSIKLGSLQRQHCFAPSHKEQCPRADPTPQRVEPPAQEVDKPAGSPAPAPLLNTVVPGAPPLSDLPGSQAQLDLTDCSASEWKDSEEDGGGQRLVPTSVSSRSFQGLCLLLSRRQLVAVSAAAACCVCVCVCVCVCLCMCVDILFVHGHVLLVYPCSAILHTVPPSLLYLHVSCAVLHII